MEKKKLSDIWREAILNHIPHGEGGCLQLNKEDAIDMCRILLTNGFAVCLTGGDIGDEIAVRWVYAGSYSDLNWADYNNVVFCSTDYLEDYPQALREQTVEEEEKEARESLMREEDYID